jgi:hypothetical protein
VGKLVIVYLITGLLCGFLLGACTPMSFRLLELSVETTLPIDPAPVDTDVQGLTIP